jgi:hypothetical protein
MILRELFEARAKSVGIIFGRFNPPHMGHMKAWEMASENSAWYVGTNKSTQGPKDPLPFDIKVKAMEAVYPEIKGHIVAEQSWLTLASKVYEKHGNIVLNVYTDEAWVTKALVQYNGKEGAHGYYEFGTIQQQDTPRLSSATALRNAVAADDRDLFGQAAGVDPNTLVAGHPFFDVVKHYLMSHAEKAAAKPVKKKVKEPVAELSNDLLGRYKKAAGADASTADKAGDYARGNKRFSGIVKATKKQFANDEKGVAEGDAKFDTMMGNIAKPSAVKALGREEKVHELIRKYFWHKRRADLGSAVTGEHGHDRMVQKVLMALKKMNVDLSTMDPSKLKAIKGEVYEQGVAEGLNDTIYPNAEVIKSKNGKPVGEIYQDGNSWGAFHYKADRGYDFIDSREEAIEALKDLHQETGRSRPDYTVKGVAEAGSNAMAATASRLANKDDGKVAKLRAAGDKRREDQLKGRDIAKRDRTSKDEWGDLKQENAWDRLQRERALESAGVGIITKQNSTVDVNKNTPKKNLKAFRLI